MAARRNLVWPAVLSAGLSGCTFGRQTGDEFTSNEGGHCDEAYRAIDDPEEMTELGFSASEVLAFTDQEFQSALRWNAIERVEYVPGPGETTLTLRLNAGNVSLV
jgi:hypothetical protein